VTVMEEGSDQSEVYHIVGSAEVDPLNGRVSNESPIGQALMGQRVGTTVSYQAPAGEIHLTILDIG
jgi:transcription elongation factor GreA